jgi:hypothetical protein
LPGELKQILDFAFADCVSLELPSLPEGLQTIGEGAFGGCTSLSLTKLPEGVEEIGPGAFERCLGLRSIRLPSALEELAPGVFRGCSGLKLVEFPEHLAEIGSEAFLGCRSLVCVRFPESLRRIRGGAFHRCTMLRAAIFEGAAPELEEAALGLPGRGTVVYFHPVGKPPDYRGFRTPEWEGYPAVALDDARYPFGEWMLCHGFEHDTPPESDPDGDGVDLLTAYALGLDPNGNPRALMPRANVSGEWLSIKFTQAHPEAARCIVETSGDLLRWTSSGVEMVSSPDGKTILARVPRNGPRRFLRIRVERVR